MKLAIKQEEDMKTFNKSTSAAYKDFSDKLVEIMESL